MTFSYTVPTRSPARTETVPPKGRWIASAAASLEQTGATVNAVHIDWSFEAEERTWQLRQTIAWDTDGKKEFGRVCKALGLSGRITDVSNLNGRQAVIKVITFGGRSSAEIGTVEPVPE